VTCSHLRLLDIRSAKMLHITMFSDKSQSKEDEEMLVDHTDQQAVSTQSTSSGAALTDKVCKDEDKDLEDEKIQLKF